MENVHEGSKPFNLLDDNENQRIEKCKLNNSFIVNLRTAALKFNVYVFLVSFHLRPL